MRAGPFAFAALAALALVAATGRPARAGGLFTLDRGVRPLGRGGAFVAGADDVGAVWYNPAGLADAGSSILVDAAWLNFSSEVSRRTRVVDAEGTVRIVDGPPVRGSTPFLPIPTLGGTWAVRKGLTLAFAAWAPYTAVASYPLTVDGQPAPTRLSLVSLDGSALIVPGVYAAYEATPWLRVGAGFQTLVGTFASRAVFSASPADRLIAAPEDPAYDTLAQLEVGPIVAPSANAGVIALAGSHVRFGVSGQLPFWIDAPATIDVRLPAAAPFDRASQRGNEARVRFRLPPVLRAGVEYRTPLSAKTELRAELAYVREMWSLHDTIDIRSTNLELLDITGFPSPFGIAPISLPRNFQDSSSFRAGGEVTFDKASSKITVRAGISYETSAIPRAWVSPLTVDADKVIPSAGIGVHVGRGWRVDGVAAVAVLSDVSVDPAEARVPRINPVKGNPTATEPINGGEYSVTAVLLGFGVNYRF